jgi:hypothetical protein
MNDTILALKAKTAGDVRKHDRLDRLDGSVPQVM